MKDTDLDKLLEDISSLEKTLKIHLPHWKWVLESANSIWNRCPYQVGEKVQIVKMKKLEWDSQWQFCTHFLHEGAVGVVKSRDFRHGKFGFHLLFETQSWKDKDGKTHPKPYENTFYFEENYLAPAYYEPLSCEAL
jgi:hypothetical protein